MEEFNNLLPLNDNNNNDENQDNLINNNQQVIRELKSDDYQIILFNSLPSSLYCIIISIILCLQKSNFNYDIKKDKNDDIYQASHIISYLKIMLIIYTFYIFKGIFHYFLAMKIEFNNNIYQIFISIIYFLIDLFYYIFTVAGYYSYQRLSLNFIINNLYKCIFIFCLIFIGIVHICLFFISCFYIILSFIFALNHFFDNERGFIINQGELPVILDSLLIEQKADSKHCQECYICLENIEKGDNIITLKCNESHFFHSNCIRQWLRYNISCPLCRQKYIF